MLIHAIDVKFLEDVTIEMTFVNGKIFRYDLSKMFSKYPQLEELRRNRKLFESGQIDPGGYGVVWNDELDFDAMSVYEDGEYVGEDDISINQEIGALLSMTRQELNLTQVELSKKSHIDQGDISKIEKGLGNPTIGKLNKLFNALGKSLKISVS